MKYCRSPPLFDFLHNVSSSPSLLYPSDHLDRDDACLLPPSPSSSPRESHHPLLPFPLPATMATGVGMSSCCLSGTIATSTPAGREDTVGGLPTYVAEPQSGSTTQSIVFISDIFGWQLPNVRLLADEYAKAGFYCYIPDLHSGDSLPNSLLQNIEPPTQKQETLSIVDKVKSAAIVPATLGPWLIRHREAISQPIISGFIDTVRHIPGTTKVGAIGFCWGGRYAILHARGADTVGGGVDAAYACHPSLLAIPADFDAVRAPLSLALGSKDSLLNAKSVGQIKEILEKKKQTSPSEVRVYEGQIHGFALRSDWSSEKDKEAMDEAARQGIAWFGKYLV